MIGDKKESVFSYHLSLITHHFLYDLFVLRSSIWSEQMYENAFAQAVPRIRSERLPFVPPQYFTRDKNQFDGLPACWHVACHFNSQTMA